MKKILIFDLDGTLLDTLADIHFALNASLSEHGLPGHDSDSVRSMVGHGLSELIHKALPPKQSSPSLHEGVLNTMRQIYRTDPFSRTKPYPGITILLDRLKKTNTILTVLTNKAEGIAQTIVEHFFPGIFDIVQGETPDIPRKPHPEALLCLLKKLTQRGFVSDSTNTELVPRSILIGDSEADIETAVNAGVRAIGVTWGFRNEADLRAAGAVEVVHNANDLSILLLGSGV